MYLASASASALTKQAVEVSFHRERRGFKTVRTEAIGASIEGLDLALYERNMGDANIGPKMLARLCLLPVDIYMISSACCHLKCMLQRNLGVGRVHEEHMAELIELVKRLSDDSVAASLKHQLLHTPRTID